jgi:hypothetical protein
VRHGLVDAFHREELDVDGLHQPTVIDTEHGALDVAGERRHPGLHDLARFTAARIYG